MLTLLIIVWIAWSLCRPRYTDAFHVFGDDRRRPPMYHFSHGPGIGGFHHIPTRGFGGGRAMGGFHHVPTRSFGGGHTMGGGAGRGRR